MCPLPSPSVGSLPGLATIRPPALDSFSAHGSSKRDVYSGRRGEAKALANLCKIQLVYVVDGSQAVARVCVEIRFECVLGTLLQVVVLANELLELRLDVDNLLGGEVKLHDGDAGRLEVRQEADFVGLEEEQTAASLAGATGGSADTVNVVAGVVRRVKLDNKVDSRNLGTISQYSLPEDY